MVVATGPILNGRCTLTPFKFTMNQRWTLFFLLFSIYRSWMRFVMVWSIYSKLEIRSHSVVLALVMLVWKFVLVIYLSRMMWSWFVWVAHSAGVPSRCPNVMGLMFELWNLNWAHHLNMNKFVLILSYTNPKCCSFVMVIHPLACCNVSINWENSAHGNWNHNKMQSVKITIHSTKTKIFVSSQKRLLVCCWCRCNARCSWFVCRWI